VPMWCVAPLDMNEGNSLGQGYNRPTGCSAEKAPHATFNFLTSAINGGGWLTKRSGRFMPVKETWCAMYRRMGETQGRSEAVLKMSPPTGFNRRTVKLLA
jgi:hypothetical protein